MSTDVQIRLTRDEFDALLVMSGMALAMALQQGDRAMMASFLKLANAINRDNPNWKPYEIPENAGLPSK
jgi:hypothetical protein